MVRLSCRMLRRCTHRYGFLALGDDRLTMRLSCIGCFATRRTHQCLVTRITRPVCKHPDECHRHQGRSGCKTLLISPSYQTASHNDVHQAMPDRETFSLPLTTALDHPFPSSLAKAGMIRELQKLVDSQLSTNMLALGNLIWTTKTPCPAASFP